MKNIQETMTEQELRDVLEELDKVINKNQRIHINFVILLFIQFILVAATTPYLIHKNNFIILAINIIFLLVSVMALTNVRVTLRRAVAAKLVLAQRLLGVTGKVSTPDELKHILQQYPAGITLTK